MTTVILLLVLAIMIVTHFTHGMTKNVLFALSVVGVLALLAFAERLIVRVAYAAILIAYLAAWLRTAKSRH